jgi:hypothetical protein
VPRRDAGRARRRPRTTSPVYWPGDADHQDPRSRLHDPARDRAPAERLSRAIDDAVRRLARGRGSPASARQGAARVLERHLGPARSSTRPSSTSSRTPTARPRPGGHPAADQRRRRRRPGRGGQAAHLQGHGPGPPDVQLGDYKGFNFAPEIDTIDDARVDKVLEELRDQNATLAAVEDRGAQDGDYAVISFVGSRDGEPFEGGSSERMPLILGQERLIPGFEANLLGLEVGVDRVRHHLPRRLPGDRAGRQAAHFAVELKELRRRYCPISTTISSPTPG